MNILAIDPSGNFEEGKGTSGFCFWDCKMCKPIHVFQIRASDFKTKEKYWQAHLEQIDFYKNKYDSLIIIIENFTLNPNKAMQQSHSRMETPKLIGILQLHCAQHKVPYHMQQPAQVKNRWADPILVRRHVLVRHGKYFYLPNASKPINDHCRDAVRHAIHFDLFKNGRI